MKRLKLSSVLRSSILAMLVALGLHFDTKAQGPTATELASQMTIGWNIGNSLEVPGNETGWGNPATTQQLIDAVKAAGFNTVRIPCAWDSYANQSTYEIDPAWLARVKEVVDYCYANDMYVILNSHWDGGWLEEHPIYSMQAAINVKQDAYWTQIANYFNSYDEHLLFAGTNEVRENYSIPTAENIEVQESFNQTFVNAVRATGGNNASRVLIVQTYNTNAWFGLDYFSLPNDSASDRLFVEIHHYDPYDFTLNTNNGQACTTWGAPFAGGDVCTWGQEAYTDDLFNQVKTKWVDQGVPVVIGEFGVVKRTSLSGTAYTDHIAAREYYLEYIVNAAKQRGILSVYWDNGHNGDMGFALFDRSSGAVVDQGAIDALMAGVGTDPGPTDYNLSVTTSGSGSVSPSSGTYPSGGTVTLTASPDAGWVFSGWTGDLSGNTNPATVSMNSDKNITAVFVEENTGGSGTGSILREYWTGISGSSISALTGNSNYPSSPSGSTQMTSFEAPTNWADNYGTRVRGYVHAPTSGSYTFWVSGDDNTELYLSTDDNAANASLIASVDGWTSPQQWDKYSSQVATVNLVAGAKYYIEVLHKEGSGGDNLAVAWSGPGISQSVIDGSYLSPYEGGSDPDPVVQYTLTTGTSGNGSIAVNPAGSVFDEGSTISLTATADSGWQFDGWSGDISGSANPLSFTINANTSVVANFSEIPTGGGDPCDNPTAISMPFSYDGAGEYCWEVSGNVGYINSWSLDQLEINGVDYTNTWSNSLPSKIQGKYFIHYVSSVSWGHFEIVKQNGARMLADQGQSDLDFAVYPNPSRNGFHLQIKDPKSVSAIELTDMSGKQLTYLNTSIMNEMQIGSSLKPGVYLLRVHQNGNWKNFRVVKE
ncbi:cellulase family glycosylhydrolase [Reichenbachiella ulvae]|uniref:Cellulase family glycosylhydrolase n=1 Tax=Reichenbachiella ulvae TaxID=2980104 RepID=A0ABT3CQT6_9BACT|nr:cellulase family glycosylhydrolase [Reichenbachiella ulvae]MCV9386022.1 cellulase family glycosylhydrolase [Reichenbachiella ulvae]